MFVGSTEPVLVVLDAGEDVELDVREKGCFTSVKVRFYGSAGSFFFSFFFFSWFLVLG